jgi:phenylpropionate dioxygenase-like ring-hydroxylating dioxygenase large terminal subunit
MVSQDFRVRPDSGSGFAPAPLDRGEVEAALRPFGESRMLPRAAYVDPAVFAWEQRHFFGGGWMCVARGEQLAEPGDQRAEATGEGGVLLVRGEDGALRAFANTCRHRGHELVAPYEPERLVTAGQHRYDAAANWKTLTENYHECYHCPSIHPELCRVSPPKSGENYAADGAWIGGWMDLRDGIATMSLDGRSGGVPLRGLDAQGLRTVIYVNIFPNVLLSLHPDYVMTHRLIPVAADRTTIECTWAFAPEAVARPGFDPGYAVEFWDITNKQDWSACESVQRGLASPHASPGPLSPAEDAVSSYVTAIARGYLGQSVWSPVP